MRPGRAPRSLFRGWDKRHGDSKRKIKRSAAVYFVDDVWSDSGAVANELLTNPTISESASEPNLGDIPSGGFRLHTLNDILRFAVSLVSIVNPLGAIPVFLGISRRKAEANLEKMSTTAALAASLTLMVSLFFGQYIIRFFGISLASFTIGGGILLLITALGMISVQTQRAVKPAAEGEEPFCEKELGMMPLAFPLLAGPGAISIAIVSGEKFGSTMHWFGAFIVILLTGALIKLVLRFSQQIGQRLGQAGMAVMTKVMGLILLATSIEMVASGMKDILPVLKGAGALFSR